MFRKNGRDIVFERINRPVERAGSFEAFSGRVGGAYCCSSSLDGSWLIFSAMRSYSIIWRREICASSKDVLSCSICPFRDSRSSSGRVGSVARRSCARSSRTYPLFLPLILFHLSPLCLTYEDGLLEGEMEGFELYSKELLGLFNSRGFGSSFGWV